MTGQMAFAPLKEARYYSISSDPAIMTMIITPQRHRLTVDDYHKMGAVGILSEEDRMEMIEGEVIDRAPIGSAHAACVRYLLHAFAPQLGNAATLDIQNPLQLDEHSEPQPD